MIPVPYFRPDSVEEAIHLKTTHPGARFIVGGTDVLVRLQDHPDLLEALVSLRGIDRLQRLEVGDNALIGAAVPIADLLEHEAFCRRWPLLAQAFVEVGSVQIRNSATVGGNLCNGSPAADTAPALLVLGAQLHLQGPKGCRVVPIESFFEGPGETACADDEILVAIELPPPPQGARGVFMKKKRVWMDVAIVNLAASLVKEGDRYTKVRLAAGSVAPTPIRLRETEAALEGQEHTPERIAAAKKIAEAEVSPITDIRGGADYRRTITGVFVARALEELMRRSS